MDVSSIFVRVYSLKANRAGNQSREQLPNGRGLRYPNETDIFERFIQRDAYRLLEGWMINFQESPKARAVPSAVAIRARRKYIVHMR
jgi:hypothetical protein